METCFQDLSTYVGCNTHRDVTRSGIPRGAGLGQVRISGLTATGYILTGNSRATSGGAHQFIYRRNGVVVTRTCTPVKQGGCRATGLW